MKSTIEKLMQGEAIDPKEAKVLQVFMKNVETNIEDTYSKIISAELALATKKHSLIFLEILNNNMNTGLWRGLDGYNTLVAYTDFSEEDAKRLNPEVILNQARWVLSEKLGIASFKTRREFNDFVDTSGKEFLEIFMTEHKVIYIFDPESEKTAQEISEQEFLEKMKVNLKNVNGKTITFVGKKFSMEGLATGILQIAAQVQFNRMSGMKYSNFLSVCIENAWRNLKSKFITEEPISSKENKEYVLEFHHKFVLGQEALVEYLKSL